MYSKGNNKKGRFTIKNKMKRTLQSEHAESNEYFYDPKTGRKIRH